MKSNENDVAFLSPSYPFPPSMDFSVQNHLSLVLLPSFLSSENLFHEILSYWNNLTVTFTLGLVGTLSSILYIKSEVIIFFSCDQMFNHKSWHDTRLKADFELQFLCWTHLKLSAEFHWVALSHSESPWVAGWVALSFAEFR